MGLNRKACSGWCSPMFEWRKQKACGVLQARNLSSTLFMEELTQKLRRR